MAEGMPGRVQPLVRLIKFPGMSASKYCAQTLNLVSCFVLESLHIQCGDFSSAVTSNLLVPIFGCCTFFQVHPGGIAFLPNFFLMFSMARLHFLLAEF